MSHPGFRNAVAELAATLHRRSLDEIVGEDVRQHRRTRRLAWSAVSGLMVLTAAASVTAFFAVRQKRIADTQRAAAVEQSRIALSRQLAAQSTVVLSQFPDRLPLAVLLAVESTRLHDSLEGNLALRAGLALMPEPVRFFHYEGPDPNRGRIWAIAFSPDGSRLAAAREDGTAEILEIVSGKRAALLQHDEDPGAIHMTPGSGIQWKAPGVDEEVIALAFSPDGRLLATGSNDQTARLWDVGTGRQLASFTHGDGVSTVAFDPSSRFLATGSKDGKASVWDVSGGGPIARFAHGEEVLEVREFTADGQRDSRQVEVSEVREVAFSPHGSYLAAISTSGRTALYDVNGKEMVREWYAGIAGLGIAFSPDGAMLAAAGGEVARVWKVRSGNKLLEVTHVNHPDQDQGHLTWIDDVAFSADNKYLATAGRDNTARVWNLETGQEVVRIVHDAPVNAVAFHPDGATLSTASFDGTSRLWELPSGRERLRAVHPGGSEVVAFSPDGEQLASGGVDGDILIWGLRQGDQAARMLHADEVGAVDFSPDGAHIATGSQHGFVRIWSAKGEPESESIKLPIVRIARLVLSQKGNSVSARWSNSHAFIVDPSREPAVVQLTDDDVALSRRYIAASTSDRRVLKLWDATDGHAVTSVETDQVWDLAFDSTGKAILTEMGDHALRVWSVPELHPIGTVPAGDTRTYALSPEGKLVAAWVAERQGDSSEWNRFLDVWDVERESRLVRKPHEEQVDWMTFDPSGTSLVTGQGGEVQVLDLATLVVKTSLRHEADVDGIRFSPAESVLAAFAGRNVYVWDYSQGTLLSQLSCSGFVRDVRFSPDGRFLLTGSEDKTAAVWLWKTEDLRREACRRLDHNLTREEWARYLGALPYRRSCPGLPEGE